MGSGHKEIRKGVCPMCGHTGWCAWLPVQNGRLLRCERTDLSARPKEIVGASGQLLHLVTMSGDKFPYYCEHEQWEAFHREWKESHPGEATPRPVYQPCTQIDSDVCKRAAELDVIYRELQKNLILEDFHREYLLKEGWSNELIERYGIVSMPIDDYARYNSSWGYKSKSPWRKEVCRKMAQKFGSLKGVPPFFQKDDDWKILIPSGILFPLYNEKGQLYRMRVRLDFMDRIKGKKGDLYTSLEDGVYVQPLKGLYTLSEEERVYRKNSGKYRNLSSYVNDEEQEKNGIIVSRYKNGTSSGNHYGVYSQPEDDFYCVYVTEGEKKSILGNALLHAPFISLPGVNSFSLLQKEGLLDFLAEKGTKVFIVAFDADKTENESVLRAQWNTVEMLKSHGFYVGIADWDISLGKGIDDLLAAGHRPHFSAV